VEAVRGEEPASAENSVRGIPVVEAVVGAAKVSNLPQPQEFRLSPE